MKPAKIQSGSQTALVFILLAGMISACSSSSNDEPTALADNPVNDLPGEPIEPTEPTIPTEPTVPTEPSEPNAPVEPAEPSTPQPPIESNDPPLLIPMVDENSNLARLIDGIGWQIELTLVDLNQRLSSGVTLSEQQNICLGDFNPALGEALTMIDCEQALVTGNSPNRVESASFFDTSLCRSSLSNGNAIDCVIRQARISVPTTFVIPDTPDNTDVFVPERPQPVAGAEIFYAIEGTRLRIENNPSMLTGIFRCDYDLETGAASGDAGGANCDNIVSNIADRFEDLRPPI